MQRVRISVVRSRAYRSIDGFRIYGDGGSGVMDWVHPLTPRRILFWEDTALLAGHLLDGHLMARHLDSLQPDRHLEGTYLLDEHLQPAAVIAWEAGPYVFGRFQFAVVTEDGMGNVDLSGIRTCSQVVNSAPPSSNKLCPVSQNAGTGQITFTFDPSERLTG